MPNIKIIIEGPQGIGKTLLASIINNALRFASIKVVNCDPEIKGWGRYQTVIDKMDVEIVTRQK